MENLMYKDWKAENEAKIGMQFGDVKSSGLEHVELPLELSSGSTTTRQSSLVNGEEEAKDAEEEEEEVQQVSERAPTLPSRTTSAPRIRVTPQQRQVSSGRSGTLVGDDDESDYDECAFVFFSLVEMPREPATLKEALESSDAEEWKKAMENELKSIEENGTWELVELPEGRNAITSKWLFKIKSDANGNIERYKSRIVANGYQQKEKIFMAQPEGFDDGSGRVLKLKKALYGLKRAPRQWNLNLRRVLEEIGFTLSTADHSLFMGEQRSFMVVYAEDILIFLPSSDLVKEVMLKLQDKFKCKALGDMSFYLGLHIERDVEKRCMRVHQRMYLEALAANFGQSEGHVATPFPSGFKCVKGPEEESVGEEERRHFHSLTITLSTEPPQLAASDQVSASGQVTACCSCRLLSHQTLMWHHRLGHPSPPHLPGMQSRLLVSGLPRSLSPLPPSPVPSCLLCVEWWQRAALHSSFPRMTAPLQTLHMDVWGPARVCGQGRERYFLLVVDDYMRYTTVFPLRSKGLVVDVLIPWIRIIRLQLRERFGKDLRLLRLHSDKYGEFSFDLLRDFCRGC
ncbi:unnamed protein product [Closterium sp. NIES-54]